MQAVGGRDVVDIAGEETRGMNQSLPPVWMICLPVGDLVESVGRAQECVGQIVDSRKGSSSEFAYVIVRDPVRACLALVPT